MDEEAPIEDMPLEGEEDNSVDKEEWGSLALCQESTPAAESRRLTAQQAQFLSEVQVSVSVEIGQLSISAEQLIDLLPGHVFEFAFDPLDPLTLRVGDDEVATAQFVSKEGILGLQIVDVGRKSAVAGEQSSSNGRQK